MAILALLKIWMFFMTYFREGHFIFKYNREWIMFYEKGALLLVEKTPQWGHLL